MRGVVLLSCKLVEVLMLVMTYILVNLVDKL